MTGNDKIYSMIGLAAKAGKIASGEFATEKAVKSSNGHLVLIASDASDNTKKMFSNMCFFYKVPLVIFGTKDELGRWIGKAHRASICILDEGFAKSIEKKIEQSTEEIGWQK